MVKHQLWNASLLYNKTAKRTINKRITDRVCILHIVHHADQQHKLIAYVNDNIQLDCYESRMQVFDLLKKSLWEALDACS